MYYIYIEKPKKRSKTIYPYGKIVHEEAKSCINKKMLFKAKIDYSTKFKIKKVSLDNKNSILQVTLLDDLDTDIPTNNLTFLMDIPTHFLCSLEENRDLDLSIPDYLAKTIFNYKQNNFKLLNY